MPAPASSNTTSSTAPTPTGSQGGTFVLTPWEPPALSAERDGEGEGGFATTIWNDGETTRDTPSSVPTGRPAAKGSHASVWSPAAIGTGGTEAVAVTPDCW